MRRFLIQFESRALPGQAEEYNHWYDTVHKKDVLQVPGFISGDRYNVVSNDAQPRYVAIYEVESDDPISTLNALFAATKTMEISSTLDLSEVRITILEPR